jgi:hypothetical protein
MKVLPLHAAQARAHAADAGQLASARIESVDDEGVVRVSIGDAPAVVARIAASPELPVQALVPGAEVLVLVEPDQAPVVVSTILARLPAIPQVLELQAAQQLILRCGDATISIAADGNIEIRGERIDSEAEGIQRIKGAQVRIN